MRSIGRSPVITKSSAFKMNNQSDKTAELKNKLSMYTTNAKKPTPEEKVVSDVGGVINVNRKMRMNLKNMENLESKPMGGNGSGLSGFNATRAINKDEDLPVTQGLRIPTKKKISNDKYVIVDWESDEEDEEVHYEGYLIKISSSNNMLKRWFKLIQKDFYCKQTYTFIFILTFVDYKTNGDKEHQGMHNLSGVYIKAEESKTLNGIEYHSFSVLYPNKTRTYFCESKTEFDTWISKIRKVTGFQDLTEIYDVHVSRLTHFLTLINI